MKKLNTLFAGWLNKTKLFAVTVAAVTAVSGGVAFAGWSPDRPVLDWNNPDQRQGSLTGPVFNSFINTPYYGDERAFFDAARTDQTSTFKDVLNDVNGGSKEVILRTYVHNNANQTLNDAAHNFIGVAKNTKVRIDLPTGTSNTLRARSYISASNATPGEVTDTTELVDATPFSIQYVPGSAVAFNKSHQGGAPLSDSIVTSGAPIGDQQMNGDFPGCFDFQTIVEIHVKIVTPNSTFTKQVRKVGSKDWSKLVNVKPGEKIQWLLTFQNKGQVNLDNVDLSDQLPPNMTVVPGSVRYVDAGQDVPQKDTPLFTTGGIDFGTWKPNGGFVVRFDTVAKDDFASCEVTVRNIGFMKNKQSPQEVQDTADVKITKENCKPTTPPTTPITPVSTTPTVLPNTGPGDVIGIFASVTIAGAVAHKLYWLRRASRGL